MSHRAGFIAIVGRPNVGKSTLLNRILGQKLSIVSRKPQTTRHKILGIVNGEGYQVVFVDTPGWLETAKDSLQKALRRAAASAARQEADIVLWVAEAPPDPKDLETASFLRSLGKPLILALNKADLPDAQARLGAAEAAYRHTGDFSALFRISALTGDGVEGLLEHLVTLLPESPPYYPPDQVSDRFERFFVGEIVREKVFERYGQEIPHACAVELELYRERAGQPDEILATLFVEREGQKAILIGAKGTALERLREAAIRDIEAFLGRPVRLKLWVKVRRNWRHDPRLVREFGY